VFLLFFSYVASIFFYCVYAVIYSQHVCCIHSISYKHKILLC
jgi:hypothetical protein